MPIDASPSDLTLASRAAAGDDAAFARLYERHHAAVHHHCRRLLRCPEDAADATQQTFLNMHRRLAKGSAPHGSVAGYLLRIARHASFQVHARRKAQQVLAERSHVRDAALGVEPDHATAIEAAHAVRDAASALPERYRAVLVMREVEDLPYDAIARRLGMSENAVAQLLHRARRRLARELTHPERPLAA